MKSLMLTLALASVAIATESKPECEYWSGRTKSLDASIAVTKDKLKACTSDCHDTEVLLNSYVRERDVTQEFLDDPFYGCSKKD
jgi:hypothetical protein